MPTPKPSASSDIIRTIAESMAAFTATAKNIYANQKRLTDKVEYIERVLANGTPDDEDGPSKTDRLNVAQLERAQIRADIARMETDYIKILTAMNTMKTQVHDLVQWLSPWYVKASKFWSWVQDRKGGDE